MIKLKGMNLNHKFYVVIKTNLKQINNKRTLVNLYYDIVLVTSIRIFCTTLFTNNIKVVIQIHSFQFDHFTVHISFLYNKKVISLDNILKF